MLGDSSASGEVATTTTTNTNTANTTNSAARRDEGGEAAAAAAGASAAAAAGAGDGGTSNSGEGEEDKSRANTNVLDEGERGFGGNRWPRQETVALLKIRSEMDVAFRDASVKGPLWEEVSRKLAELGYNRSAKKCKEKFENVYKYHKRTKDGRTSKGHGKTYRFFDQLEAFDHHVTHSASQLPSPTLPPPPPKPQPAAAVAATLAASMPVAHNITTTATTVPSTTHITIPQPTISIPFFPATNPTNIPPVPVTTNPLNYQNIPADLLSNSTSSSTSSDLEFGGGRRKRKRKWRDLFERLMKEVIEKQEELQKKFLEAIEKRECERRVREEAWRMQEMTRINREREILAQERSIAAAKDAAVMAFLQKLSEQQKPVVPGQVVLQNIAPQPLSLPIPVTISQPPPAAPTPAQQPVSLPQPQPLQSAPPQQMLNLAAAAAPVDASKADNGDQNNNNANNNNNNSSMGTATSSSRWPKVEVQALIKLRTNLDSKYQENGPKGPLWEEISGGMRKLGYNRSAKRCKEKWENINKYFKKVKESNKKRSEDSKTCPYFEQLDALYKEKNKFDSSSSNQIQPENSVPLMVRPEQQWPPQPDQLRHHHHQDSAMEDVGSDQDADEDDKDMGEDEEEDDGDGDGDAGGFEIVPNKQVSASET